MVPDGWSGMVLYAKSWFHDHHADSRGGRLWRSDDRESDNPHDRDFVDDPRVHDHDCHDHADCRCGVPGLSETTRSSIRKTVGFGVGGCHAFSGYLSSAYPDTQNTTLGESVGWMSFSFKFGQHFVDFWGPALLEDIDLVAWIQSQADEGEVELLAVEQTTLFGGPATQIDVSITENRYLPFAEEGQWLMGRTRLLVTEIDGRPLLVTFSGLSCTSFPMCTADNAEANEFQFLKHISRTERFLSSVSFDR